MTARSNVKPKWSGIDVADFGPYRESVAASLGMRLWNNPGLRERLVAQPELYFEETGFEPSEGMDLKIMSKAADEFVFVVPAKPNEGALWYRYEQISNWWMLAHAFHWWMRREHGGKVDPFLQGLDVQIIGRTWTDPAWREQLLDDPRRTLETELGATFSDELTVHAVEETNAHILVLPPDPAKERGGRAADHHAELFAVAHTWWQWLVWPRLMRSVDASMIDRMVK